MFPKFYAGQLTMRKLVAFQALALTASQSLLAQGTVVFNNRVPGAVESPVLGTGRQPLSGPGYTAQLFGGPTNAMDDALQPLVPATTFRPAPGEGYVVVPAQTVAVPGVPEGSQARLQLRAWDNRGGTITQWSQVMANGTIPRGASPSFVSARLGGLFFLPANLTGLQSFQLTAASILLLHGSARFDPAFSFHITFTGEAGANYQIQRTTGLQAWQPIGFATNGPGLFYEFYDLNPDPTNAFYRAEALPSPSAAKP
jgi:hypothetical protein